MDILKKRLRLCGEIEKQTAHIYEMFELFFSAGRDLFHSLVLSEKNHAGLVEKAKAFHARKVLPRRFVPDSTLELEHTLYYLNRKKGLLSRDMSLKEACNLALEIENLTGEKYLQEVILGKVKIETDGEMAELLKTLAAGEKLHSEFIREFMASKSFLPE